MTRTKVGVLRGGPNTEFEVSLETGKCVLEHLPSEKYEGVDIFVDREGEWHVRGMPLEPIDALKRVDVVFNAMHGPYGEDGTVQKLLDQFRVPYNGSGALASAIAMNKLLTKQRVEAIGIQTPRCVILEVSPDLESTLSEIFRTFPQPAVVKPLSCGSSIGVTIAHGYHNLIEGARRAFEHCPKILVEEYIPGREAAVGILEDFRNQEVYAFPPIEIIPPTGKDFFDYDAKYSGESQEICPGNFTREVTQQLENLAREVHTHLDLRHYSRSDFIVSPRGIYFLEVNTLPGLTDGSLLPKAVAAVGSTQSEFLDHVISLALNGK